MKAKKCFKNKHFEPIDASNYGIYTGLNLPIGCDIVQQIKNPFKSIDFSQDLPKIGENSYWHEN